MARFGAYRAHLRPAPDYESLTLSGNEQTDLTRVAAVEGDGLALEESYGIWEATTNLITNGGFESNATGWNEQGSTTTRVTGQQKFGAAAGQVVTDDAGANEGPYHAFGGAAATKYAVSAWVRGSGTVRIALWDDISGKQASSAITLTSDWQRVTHIATTGGGSGTFRIYVETDSQQDITFNVDGVQTEAQDLPTPYVETDGGTASRSASLVQIPGAVLNATQGWVAICVRMGWPNGTLPSGTPYFYDMYQNSENRSGIFFFNNDFYMQHMQASANKQIETLAQSFSPGDLVTVVGYWDAGTIGISANGAAFRTTTRNADIVVPSVIHIGSRGNPTRQHQDSSTLWFACGHGLVGQADSVLMTNFGNQVTDIRDFPQHLRPTGLWSATNDRLDSIRAA